MLYLCVRYKSIFCLFPFARTVKVLAPPYTDVIKKDPALHTVRPEPVVYRCKKCRRVLATASNLLTHVEKKTPLWFDFQGEEDATEAGALICSQMFFIEPITWMTSVAQSLQGKLHCPNQNCKSKLGSFSWVMGESCLSVFFYYQAAKYSCS